jgi:NAD(P)H-nitrite reductase large subunit
MAITGITPSIGAVAPKPATDTLCPCLEISRTRVTEMIRQGRLTSPEAILAATHVGEGTCHGQLCAQAFQRILVQEGIADAVQFIDWRFPWTDWGLQ